jgi:polysaccharide biosynthesis transport protein
MSVASQPARPSSAGPAIDGDFDLPALGAALWRQKWKILRPTLLVALVTLGVVQVITPKYLSESRVLIESSDTNVFLRPDADKTMVDRTVVDEEAVTSQVQLVLSRDLARDVIGRLKLGERPEFDPALNGISPVKMVLGLLGLIKNPMRMTPEERVLDAYYDRLTVYPVEKSRVIVIDFLSEDPDLAASVANAIAEAYLVRQRAAKQDQARTAVQWLSGEIESLQRKVAEAEARVEAFRASSNLLMGPNNITLSAQQLADFNAQLAAARAQEADAEAKAKLIREMLRTGQPIEYSDILNSELIRRLAEQRVTLRAQLAEQSSSLLDGHPRIKELKAQIANLEQQIRVEAETIARSFENDAKLASARVVSLTASFDRLKTQAAATNEQDVELRALERDAKAQRDLLESYMAKYREATARDTLASSPADARVISRATVSNVPAYPKKLPSVLIATLAMMVLCCGFVLTRELLTVPGAVAAPAARVAPVARRRFGLLPAKATVVANAPSVDRAPETIGVPISAIADVAYSLRHAGNAVGRIAVLGASGNFDSGEPAVSLARALAESARVVLVGVNPDNEAIQAASSDPSAVGLAELAGGTASFRDIISKDKHSALHLISSGRTPIERLALLSSPALANGFDALARSYDYVVVDAGAAGGGDLEVIGEIAPHAVLLAETLSGPVTAAAHQRLIAAGFDDVTVLLGAHAGRPSAKAAAA